MTNDEPNCSLREKGIWPQKGAKSAKKSRLTALLFLCLLCLFAAIPLRHFPIRSLNRFTNASTASGIFPTLRSEGNSGSPGG
jgi:hypothetical protein